MSRKNDRKFAAHVAQLHTDFGVEATICDRDQFGRVHQLLLERFFQSVKRATGKWIHRGYRWHAYSFGYASALHGPAAFDAYVAQRIEPFYTFFECDDLLLDCTATQWPDLRPLESDIYVFPHRMHWLFVTTHEMSIDLGPYFAKPDNGEQRPADS